MRELGIQVQTIWKGMKRLQKISLLVIAGLIMLSFFLLAPSSQSYTPLFPHKSLTGEERKEIKKYLENYEIPFKENKGELAIPPEFVENVRKEWAPNRKETGKGFELFDTHTWSKGEKELQVLEMRALKGQLEKDLMTFEQIKSAHVILDLPPARSLKGANYPTKASVILTLMPDERLGPAQLKAITNHLSGAVRGLEPHMIAIADTKGRLYKSLDPLGQEEYFPDSQLEKEAYIQDKIEMLLTKIVGREQFYLHIQGEWEKSRKIFSTLLIGIILNQSVDINKTELERQLYLLTKRFGEAVTVEIDFIPFAPAKISRDPFSKAPSFIIPFIATCIFLLAALVCVFLGFRRGWFKKRGVNLENLASAPSTLPIDMSKLAQTIQREKPATIAHMLSYLEASKAEQILSALPEAIQEAVLGELEKGG